jgi:ABC-2 type transport system ATP-binding protein
LLRADAGTVTVLGRPAGSAEVAARVGLMPQSTGAWSGIRAVERVDLVGHSEDLVGNLSGGQKSRVSLAAALVGDPDLLVLDEPTVGLDPVLRRDLWGLFHELARQGTTLLVSSHVMDEATRCDRLLLLREGEVLADDTPDGLLRATGARDAESAFLHLIDSADDTADETGDETEGRAGG